MGNTSVVCGVTAELAEPTLEAPEEGYIGITPETLERRLTSIVSNVVLSPLCNPKFRVGPPSDFAQSLSSRIYDLILATSPELRRSLCLERGKCVWSLFIDIQFLNYDGNALDSAWLSVSSALARMKLPPVQFNVDINRGVVVDGMTLPVEFAGNNIFACSFVGIDEGKYILSDPDEEEESIATESITVVIDQKHLIRYLYKGGLGFQGEDIRRCVELAGDRAAYLSFVVEQSASKIEISD